MSFTRVNPGGWVTGNQITQTQINDLDTNVSYALDARQAHLEIVDGPASLTRQCGIVVLSEAQANWTTLSLPVTTAVNTALHVQFPMFLPAGCAFKSCTVSFQGATGHGGTLPTNMPKIDVLAYDYDGTAHDPSITKTDASASAATFEAKHDITTATTSLTIDGTRRYYILVTTESGGTAQAGALIYGAKYTFEASALVAG